MTSRAVSDEFSLAASRVVFGEFSLVTLCVVFDWSLLVTSRVIEYETLPVAPCVVCSVPHVVASRVVFDDGSFLLISLVLDIPLSRGEENPCTDNMLTRVCATMSTQASSAPLDALFALSELLELAKPGVVLCGQGVVVDGRCAYNKRREAQRLCLEG